MNKWDDTKNDCEIRLAVCRKLHQDILHEVDKLKDQLAEIRQNPPHCYCSAVVYGSKVRVMEKEILEWESLAQNEAVEMSRLEELVKSERDNQEAGMEKQ